MTSATPPTARLTRLVVIKALACVRGGEVSSLALRSLYSWQRFQINEILA